jgi:Icc-related predicted phosphoesterase
MLFKKPKEKEKKFTRIFFTTDIHGSERAYRKFLNAGKYYGVDIVMLCGDLTGKMIVPIVEYSSGIYKCKLFGQEYEVKTEEVKALEEKISGMGYYPYYVDKKGMEEMQANPKIVNEIFKKLMLERLERWVKMAEEHYQNSGIKCIMSAGNDDLFDVDQILNNSNYVINAGDKIIRVDDYHEMLTVGYANITPWNCPRDVSEEKLKEVIENLANKLENPQTSIFNLHAPPKDSTLDTAFKLDTSTFPPKVITEGGQPVTIGVGSIAVREAIEKHQPLLGLHGHIHESRGVTKIGRTLCINPGSEYGEGILRGAIVNLTKDSVLSYQLTSG